MYTCPQILRRLGRLPWEPPAASDGSPASISLNGQLLKSSYRVMKVETWSVWCVAPVDVLGATQRVDGTAGLKTDHTPETCLGALLEGNLGGCVTSCAKSRYHGRDTGGLDSWKMSSVFRRGGQGWRLRRAGGWLAGLLSRIGGRRSTYVCV